MFQNDYATVIEKWKVDLIVSRAKRLGFQRQDLEDAQQSIVLELLAFQFDPSKANGATESTAVTSVIDHQLLNLRRRRNRYARRVTECDNDFADDNAVASAWQDGLRIAVRSDLDTATSRLTPIARQICELLADGLSLNEIATALGVGWHTVNRHLQHIRQCFEQLGLDASDCE
jgi:RNA polymerase sigma factor (sigma-70 family)